MGLLVCAAIAVAGASIATERDACAADAERPRDHGARWVVEVRGPADASCMTERATFEREITLACAAVGTCHLVDDRRDAELFAILRCEGRAEPWTLEVRTVEGSLVSSMELTGANEDRLREAAIEVARDQAPERTLAAASLRDTLGDGERARKNWKAPTMAFALGGLAMAGGPEQFSGGGRGTLGLKVANSTHLTLGLAGVAGGSGPLQARHGRGGLGLAFGAPFDGSIFGMMLEGGVDVSQSYDTGMGYRTATPQTRAGAYGMGSVFVALPLFAVHPYLAFDAGAFSQPKTTIFAAAELGIAFPL